MMATSKYRGDASLVTFFQFWLFTIAFFVAPAQGKDSVSFPNKHILNQLILKGRIELTSKQISTTVLMIFASSTNVFGSDQDDHHGAHYHFDYSVHAPHTGDKKAQTETRDGKFLKGSYTLHEADGTKRVVEYASDPYHGFQALVKRLGHAEHPHHAESHVGVTHWGHF
ncbi:larval cuticle protein A2B-like [Agrilus planipennis]|uniref:Larval cuticle protein A2B-like n=1 Tax=Agrilus planipennis TaxID=224129 RepID=A0A7F5QVY9_AGRPL|nr:larval cuticle protein A2B-like [Agrilus planipennis]